MTVSPTASVQTASFEGGAWPSGVGDTVILPHPPLPLAGFSQGMDKAGGVIKMTLLPTARMQTSSFEGGVWPLATLSLCCTPLSLE